MGCPPPALRLCLACGHVGCCDKAKNKQPQAFQQTTVTR